MAKITPRGVRNNNPLNIRIGNTWLGETNTPTDSEFEQFVNVKYGLRAAFYILRRYIRRYQKNTIRKIIETWAPSSENNTERYIKYVCDQMKMEEDVQIKFEDEATMCALVKAMAKMESGMDIEDNIVEQSYKMA